MPKKTVSEIKLIMFHTGNIKHLILQKSRIKQENAIFNISEAGNGNFPNTRENKLRISSKLTCNYRLHIIT